MDLWTALLTVIRRWYISVPILLLGVIATFAAGSQIKPKYTTTSSIILIAPTQTRTPEGLIEPWRNSIMLGSGVRGAGATVVTRLNRTSVANRLESFGRSTDYFVAQTREGDVIEFAVEGDSEQQAIDTARDLMDEAQTNLQEIQLVNLRVPENELIRSEVLTEPDEPEEQTGSRPRVMAMVALLSIGAAGAAAILVENLSQRRKAELLAAAPSTNGAANGHQPFVGTDGVTYVPVMANAGMAPAAGPANGYGAAAAPTASTAASPDHDHDLDLLLADGGTTDAVAPVRRPAQTLDNGRRAGAQRVQTGQEVGDEFIDLDGPTAKTGGAPSAATPTTPMTSPTTPSTTKTTGAPSSSSSTPRRSGTPPVGGKPVVTSPPPEAAPPTGSITPPTGAEQRPIRGSIKRPGSNEGSLFDRNRNPS